MGDRRTMSTRGNASRPTQSPKGFRAAYRRLRDRKAGESTAGRPTEEAKLEATKASKETGQEAHPGPRIVECPECGSAAIVQDHGVTLSGVGFCGHEILFKMVKLECVSGHRLDGMDELGSVHAPGETCKGIVHG